jgi:hypothetical protein
VLDTIEMYPVMLDIIHICPVMIQRLKYCLASYMYVYMHNKNIVLLQLDVLQYIQVNDQLLNYLHISPYHKNVHLKGKYGHVRFHG